MILLDSNILLYAFIDATPQHIKARRWLETAIEDNFEPLAVSWTVILAFIRISTNNKVFTPSLNTSQVEEILRPFLDHTNVRIIDPLNDHFPRLLSVMKEGQALAALTMDAHLATLALEHGAKIATTDRDFSRFQGVKIIDPLKD